MAAVVRALVRLRGAGGRRDDLDDAVLGVHPDNVEWDANLEHPVGMVSGAAVQEEHAAIGRERSAVHHPTDHVPFIGQHLGTDLRASGERDKAGAEVLDRSRLGAAAGGGEGNQGQEQPRAGRAACPTPSIGNQESGAHGLK